MPALRGAGATLAVAVLGVATVFVPVGSAAAAAGRCAPGKGVTVVVDFGALGGGAPVGCVANGAGRSAWDVLEDAGFDLDGVPQYGSNFVCRVLGKPATENCQNTPPPDAYWALFWSDGDPATWSYSGEGVGSLDVPEGGSIGLRWQDGGDRENPLAAPTAGKAPTPRPAPTPQPQAKPQPKPQPSTAPGPSPADEPSTGAQPTPDGSTVSGTDSPAVPSARPERDRPGKKGTDNPGAGRAGKADKVDEGGKRGTAGERDRASSTPETVTAVTPTSGAPAGSAADSGLLPLVAGGAMVVLAVAAGVIGWRRRS